MRIQTTDKLPEIDVAGINRVLQIHPDVHQPTQEAIDQARAEEQATPLRAEQSMELRNFPRYEEAHVQADATFMHPALRSKRELVDWVLTMLGYPLVGVELRQNHFDAAINNALLMYTKYATFPKRYLLKSTRDYVPGVGIDLSRENVCQVYEVNLGVDFSNWGTVLPWMVNRTQTGYHGSGNLAGSFITYHNFTEFKSMARRLLSSEPDWQFNQVSKRLVLIPEPPLCPREFDAKPPYHSELWPNPDLGHTERLREMPMVLEVECEPPLEELYCTEHVRRLTLAYCKIILGQIRGKYDGISLPGGGSVSKEIGAEGKEELAKLQETMRSEVSMGQEVFFA